MIKFDVTVVSAALATRWVRCVSLTCATLTACGPMPTGGNTDSGADVAVDASADSGGPSIASGTLSGTYSGTLSDAQVAAFGSTAGPTAITLNATDSANGGGMGGEGLLSDPGGPAGLSISISIYGEPVVGTYSSSTATSCGNVGANIGSFAAGNAQTCLASSQSNSASGCNTQTSPPPAGSYTLTLTSVAVYSVVGGVQQYTVHGSLAATVPPVPGGGCQESVQLTF